MSVDGLQERTGEASFVYVPSAGVSPVGTDGGVVSIWKGPRCSVDVQLPTLSTVAMWKYQSPFDVAVKVAPVQDSSCSFVSLGVQLANWFYSISNPSTPLPLPSLAPDT